MEINKAVRLKSDQEKETFVNDEAKDSNKAAYNIFERIFFIMSLLIIGALGLVLFIPLFCLAQMRRLLLYIKRGKGKFYDSNQKSHITLTCPYVLRLIRDFEVKLPCSLLHR